MLRNLPTLISLIFLGATVSLAAFFLVPLQPGLRDNLVSELIGLSLEGLLFVGLFQALSSWKERRDKSHLRDVLRRTITEIIQILNESAIKSVVSYMWSLRFESSNPNFADRAKAEMEVIEPFCATLDTPSMRSGINGLKLLLDFFDSADGIPYKTKIPLWRIDGVNSGLLRLESFYHLAAMESPKTLATWSDLVMQFRACMLNHRQFPSSELRALGAAIERTKI